MIELSLSSTLKRHNLHCYRSPLIVFRKFKLYFLPSLQLFKSIHLDLWKMDKIVRSIFICQNPNPLRASNHFTVPLIFSVSFIIISILERKRRGEKKSRMRFPWCPKAIRGAPAQIASQICSAWEKQAIRLIFHPVSSLENLYNHWKKKKYREHP